MDRFGYNWIYLIRWDSTVFDQSQGSTRKVVRALSSAEKTLFIVDDVMADESLVGDTGSIVYDS